MPTPKASTTVDFSSRQSFSHADSRAEAVCETCGGTGADPGAIVPTGEPCPDCSGRRELAKPITTTDAFASLRQSLAAPRKGPATVLALVGYGNPNGRSGYAEIGNGLYVRTGRRK